MKLGRRLDESEVPKVRTVVHFQYLSITFTHPTKCAANKSKTSPGPVPDECQISPETAHTPKKSTVVRFKDVKKILEHGLECWTRPGRVPDMSGTKPGRSLDESRPKSLDESEALKVRTVARF